MVEEKRHRPVTFQGVDPRRRSSMDELLAEFHIDGFVSDDEFARDLEKLVNGEMSPEEHREYLRKKYQHAA